MGIFCECGNCGKNIYDGEQCYSLTLSRDFVESETIVQPLEANSVVVWCIECGPEAVKQLMKNTKKEWSDQNTANSVTDYMDKALDETGE